MPTKPDRPSRTAGCGAFRQAHWDGPAPGSSDAPAAGGLGLNARASLADNDGHGFFGALGDQVVTGPTLTNVNDFRAVLVNSP